MTTHLPPALLAGAAALALSACTGDTNPATGNFFDGVSGLASGTYQQRVDDKNAQLESAQAEQAWLQQEAASVDQERAEVAAQVGDAERRLNRVDRNLAKLESEVNQARNANRISEQKRTALQSEIDDLRLSQQLLASDPVVDVQTKQRRIAELEARERELEATLSAALQ